MGGLYDPVRSSWSSAGWPSARGACNDATWAADLRHRAGVDPLIIGLVAISAVLHVAWNVRLKTAGDPLRSATGVAPMSGVAPLRESATVFAAAWGSVRLGEAVTGRDTIRRVGASVLIVAGALLLALGS